MITARCLVAFVAVSTCIASMAHIVISDLMTRLISIRACEVLGAAGALYQLSLFGLGGLGASLLSMAAITIVNVIVNGLFQYRGHGQSVGGGDVRCMAALALATGRGCIVGALACCIVAVVWAAAMQMMGQRDKDEPFAFAPFMAVWLVVGLVVGLPV